MDYHKLSRYISIHALREEGDLATMIRCWQTSGFLSTPSARRATVVMRIIAAWSMLFLSTPSARRATRSRIVFAHESLISIHALREEGDGPAIRPGHLLFNFYPRPPRGGRP